MILVEELNRPGAVPLDTETSEGIYMSTSSITNRVIVSYNSGRGTYIEVKLQWPISMLRPFFSL